MKILYVWPGLTGYMGDCWRALGKHAQVRVLVDGLGLGENFSDEVMSGIDWMRVTDADVVEKIQAFDPDALVVVGWRRQVPRKAVFAQELETVPKLLVMDMPWRWSVRCVAARFVLSRYLRRFRGALVHGAASARYARWLGFDDARVWRHCICGVDLNRWTAGEGAASGGRKDFLFVGRKVPEKGIEVLKKAYAAYRQNGGRWTLSLPEWIDPRDVPQMMREHASLVLPSLWEPWGVVVAEAKAAGMKVIVSDKVGARFDLPCDEVVAAGDVQALADAMARVEVAFARGDAVAANETRFPIEHFGCEAWAARVMGVVREVAVRSS